MIIGNVFERLKERLKQNEREFHERWSWMGDTETGFYTEVNFDMDKLFAEIDKFSAELQEKNK